MRRIRHTASHHVYMLMILNKLILVIMKHEGFVPQLFDSDYYIIPNLHILNIYL